MSIDREARSRPGQLVALLVLVLALGLGLLFVELGLRIALNASDFLQATTVDDPALGHRIAPGSSGHDALGYRNKAVPATARIVAIGDSHTYGVSAPRDGSWPSHLGAMLGEPVYNLGLGGFGPLQYLHLTKTTARDLKPEVVVVGFYFGNDLVDAYGLAHGRPHWHAWRSSVAPAPTAAAEPEATQQPAKRFKAVRDWLARHSMLYSVLRATVFQRLAASERARIVERSTPDDRWSWADPAAAGARTTFTPRGRLSAVDLDEPAVREGLRISERALAEVQSEVARQGAQLLVVLIPTKERAYCAYLGATKSALPPAHARLCDAEERTKAELRRALSERRIDHVDATSALEARIAAHEQLYPPDDDGHELSSGYRTIAGVVAAALAGRPSKP